MSIITKIGTDLIEAKRLLTAGEAVAIPTETVYGLAANGLEPKSVVKIFQIKERPFFDPLILHTDHLDKIITFVTHLPDHAFKIAELFWPGPVTLVLPKAAHVPDLATAGLNTVGVRIPQHPLTLALLASLDFPLAAPSANPFGYISPTTAQHVYNQLGNKIPYILDGGACKVGVESTIVGFEGDVVVIYRLGGLNIELLEDQLKLKVKVKSENEENPAAPGMLKSHYAPSIPMYRWNQQYMHLGEQFTSINELQIPNQFLGVIAFNKPYNNIPDQNQVVLAPNGDLGEAAQNLFAAMRYLDQLPLQAIICDTFPSIGLGMAINDRLRRASI